MSVTYTRTYSTSCSGALLDFINIDVIITPVLEQIINIGTGDLEFQFASTLSAPEIAQFDNILSTFTCPVSSEISTYSAVINDQASGNDILWSSTQIMNSLAAQDELSELQDVQLAGLNSADILKFNGTKWINGPDLNSAGYTNIVTKTANYTLTLTNVVILCYGLLTITLPTAIGALGKTYHIKNIGTQPVTINTSGGMIDGNTGIKITRQYNSYMIVSDGSNWFVV